MIRVSFICFIALISHTFCDEALLSIVEAEAPDGGENEHVWVDIKKIDPATNTVRDETKLQVNLHFHLRKGIVHLNGRPVNHNFANSIHLIAQITEYSVDGTQMQRQEAVVVRVLVETRLSEMKRIFTIEEEVVAIGREDVMQVDVKQIVIESNDNVNEYRRSLLTLKIEESKLHQMPREHDRHSGDLKPMLPDTPLYADDEPTTHEHEHKHRHHHHHHGHHKLSISCWFHKLSLKSRICIFIVLILFAITFCLCCSLCCKRKKKTIVKLMTDEDEVINDMTVDMEEVKVEDFKKDGEEGSDFHFELDHKIDIDDKQKLLEE